MAVECNVFQMTVTSHAEKDMLHITRGTHAHSRTNRYGIRSHIPDRGQLPAKVLAKPHRLELLTVPFNFFLDHNS